MMFLGEHLLNLTDPVLGEDNMDYELWNLGIP